MSGHDYSGQRHGAWTILERDRSRRGTWWRAVCDCGVVGSLFAGDIQRGRSLACMRCAGHARRSPAPSYRVVHNWLKRDRGRAADHVCACGKQASSWAYCRCDATLELTEVVNGWLVTYSPDVEAYDPLCRACHAERDRGHGTKVEASDAS